MDKSKVKKSKNSRLFKNTFTIGLLIVGAAFLCVFLALMQNYSAEKNQEKNSLNILEEVEVTLDNNDRVVQSVMDKYNSINQTTLSTFASYIEYIDVLEPLRSASDSERAEVMNNTSRQLKKICEDISVEDALIIAANNDTSSSSINGQIIIASDLSLITDANGNPNKIPTQLLANFATHQVDENGVAIKNGTVSIVDGKTVYSPYFTTYDDQDVYLYSTYFTSADVGGINTDFYILTYVKNDIIESELENLKSLEAILSGITVGKNGFLFAVDKYNKKFSYFKRGELDLTGKPYEQYGLKQSAVDYTSANKDYYSGYQKIDNVSYYCVTKEYQSQTFGDFTVIAAVVSKDEIVSKNVMTIVSSCIAFVIVSAIVAGYGLVLRRDVADHILGLEEKYRVGIKDDATSGFTKLTEEEVDERVKILLEEDIEKNKDKKLKRKNIGVRNSKGKQRYFSFYIFGKMFAATVVGLIVIFLISFFAQTLLGLSDATSVSKDRLTEIVVTVDNNRENNDSIQAYVDEQFLSKARLIAYLLEETPEVLFIEPTQEVLDNDKTIKESKMHYIYAENADGTTKHLYYTEYYDEETDTGIRIDRQAISYSYALEMFCRNNGLESIYIIGDDARTMATNTDEWYFQLSNNPEDSSYPFRDVINDKKEYYIQKQGAGKLSKNIGTQFHYYTYVNGTNIGYASKSQYDSYIKTGSWIKNDIAMTDQIIKHNALLQIGIDENSLADLFETTEISYILDHMYVHGKSSFFMAFDTTDEHKVVYAPEGYETTIGKPAASIGVSNNIFAIGSTYNGFQKVNGVEYYQSVEQVGDYYIATAIPTSTIYETRNTISLYTLLFSAIFIILASSLFTVSSDKSDKDYCNVIKYKSRNESNNTFYISTPSGRRKRTNSVSSRFSKISWSRKTPEEKLSAILMVYLTIASVMIFVALIYAINSGDEDSIFTYIFSGVWEKGFNVFAITQALMIMIIIITVTKLVQICVKSFCGTLGARVETTGNLIVSVLKYGGVIGGLFYCLYLFGLNTASLLTSAGILSIVIGLGAQSLIADIIAGMFIVFEGSFRVGDIVTIGDFRGQVLEIGLRTTKIEDIAKNIKIFNNSSISGVLNMTKEASYASVDIGIEYGESLEKVEKLLKNEFPRMRRRIPEITDGPFYKGVQELGASSVNIRITAQCEEKDRLQLSRDLNREIFLLFGRNNINIPFPQVTLSYLDGDNANKEASNTVKKEAREFVDEQRALAADKESQEGA